MSFQALSAELRSRGIRQIVFCPGARALPLLNALRDTFEVVPFYDERSAAFFALARHETACVVTTSGTAVANLFPAVMEALHTRKSLIVVTADRPARARGRGTAQGTDQREAFGRFAAYWEWPEQAGTDPNWRGPIQINVCVEDPLRASGTAAHVYANWAEFSEGMKAPLVMVGEIPRSLREPLERWLLQLRAPCYLEPLSGLRERPTLQAVAVHSLSVDLPIDRVIRVGGVPVHRFYRDLEGCLSHVPVATLESDWPGLMREVTSVAALPERVREVSSTQLRTWQQASQRASVRLQTLLESHPRSEAAQMARISERLPRSAGVYLGNSMPIRHWDLAATREDRGFEVRANRGLNGIDGQVSSFFGWDHPGPKVALLGDLTTLHDVNGLSAVERSSKASTLVVFQNRGGRIFDFGLPKPIEGPCFAAMVNDKNVKIKDLARAFGIDALTTDDLREQDLASGGPRVVELVCDPEATRAFWRDHGE